MLTENRYEEEAKEMYEALIMVLSDVLPDTPENIVREKLTKHNIKSFNDFMNIVYKEAYMCIEAGWNRLPLLSEFTEKVSIELAITEIFDILPPYNYLKDIRSIEDFVNTVRREASGVSIC